MKLRTITPFFFLLLIVAACKKEEKPVTVPVSFDSTTYQTLGAYDTSGKPSNLSKDTVSAGIKTFMNSNIQEGVDLRTTHPELLSSTAIADIRITKPSDVSVTFVSQGAGKANAVAFYTYPTANPPASASDIKQIVYIFPNAGKGTTLKSGDKVNIGHFDVGTSIGFVLMQGAWDPTTKTLNNSAVHFCSNDVLNPEVDPNLKKHAVLMSYPAESKVLVGFEDFDRTEKHCDHDFNDVVIYTTVK
jgi:hypothetical protein